MLSLSFSLETRQEYEAKFFDYVNTNSLKFNNGQEFVKRY